MTQGHTDTIRISHEDYEWIMQQRRQGQSAGDVFHDAVLNYSDGRTRMRRELMELCDRFRHDTTIDRHRTEDVDVQEELISLARIIIVKLVTDDEPPIGQLARMNELMGAIRATATAPAPTHEQIIAAPIEQKKSLFAQLGYDKKK